MTEVKGAGTERKCSGVVTSALTPTDRINSLMENTESGPPITTALEPAEADYWPGEAGASGPCRQPREAIREGDHRRRRHRGAALDAARLRSGAPLAGPNGVAPITRRMTP